MEYSLEAFVLRSTDDAARTCTPWREVNVRQSEASRGQRASHVAVDGSSSARTTIRRVRLLSDCSLQRTTALVPRARSVIRRRRSPLVSEAKPAVLADLTGNRIDGRPAGQRNNVDRLSETDKRRSTRPQRGVDVH